MRQSRRHAPGQRRVHGGLFAAIVEGDLTQSGAELVFEESTGEVFGVTGTGSWTGDFVESVWGPKAPSGTVATRRHERGR